MRDFWGTFYYKKDMMQFISRLFGFILALWAGIPSVWAVELPADIDFARQGERILARLEFSIPAGYHAYAYKAQGAGKPTRLDFILANEGRMPILYPEGREERDIFEKSKITRVYTGNVVFYASLPMRSESRLYTCKLDLLLCSSKHCMPMSKTFTGEVPADIPMLNKTAWQTQAEEALIASGLGSGKTHMEEGALPPLIKRGRDYSLDDDLSKGRLLNEAVSAPAAPDNRYPDLRPRYFSEDLEIYSLGKAILFGLLAGLILNAMPCVLPVLTLKVGSLMILGQTGSQEKRREFRIHNLCFAAGILSLFTLLGFLLGAADGVWGQLYQNHAILVCMLLLVFLMGLSMLGVFTLPTFDLRMATTSPHPGISAYLTGFVSTFLATPCSGPLLGGVLAWAFTQPMAIFMTIFWSVGVGMGLPYIVFAIWPSMARILPKPGEWMQVFERVLGFLLLGTALYLLSILPETKYVQILILLILAGLCAWIWGAYCGLGASRLRKICIGGICALGLGLTVWWVLQPRHATTDWTNFTVEEFHKDLGNDNLLIEFTADWCPNCKYLEATVLTPDLLEILKSKYSLRLLKADLTNSNPAAEQLLELLGSRSIPLTALFARGDRALSPLVLRDLYDAASIKKATSQTFTNP